MTNSKAPFITIGLIFLAVILLMFVPRFFVLQRLVANTLGGGNLVSQVQPNVANAIPVNANDHWRGQRQAPIKIIEYSDFQCPFCAQFHPIIKKLLQNYPDRVQWIYRHFPITSSHPQAGPAAVASECIAELAGNDAFWQFADAMFANQDSMNVVLYAEIADILGISEAEYNSCVTSDKYNKKIEAHFQNAVDAGAQGTPYLVILFPDGRRLPVAGVASYEALEVMINE